MLKILGWGPTQGKLDAIEHHIILTELSLTNIANSVLVYELRTQHASFRRKMGKTVVLWK